VKAYELSVIADLAVRKLKSEGGLSSNKISSIKTIGFRAALKHFESVGNVIVDNDMLRGFLEKQYCIYKDDKELAWRWKYIRENSVPDYFLTRKNWWIAAGCVDTRL